MGNSHGRHCDCKITVTLQMVNIRISKCRPSIDAVSTAKKKKNNNAIQKSV